MPTKHIYDCVDIAVSNAFIRESAQEYVDQRTATKWSVQDLENSPVFKQTGFSASGLMKTLKKSVIPDRKKISQDGQKIKQYRDIYRSDLGELLMTSHFEKKALRPIEWKVFEASTMEQDCRAEVLKVPEPMGVRFDALNLAVDPLGGRV